jgi:hypothetical protein
VAEPEGKRLFLPVGILALGLAGGLAGGVLGHLGFLWIARQGYYAMILPGALTGIACGLAARRKSNFLGAACVVIAAFASIYSEWKFAPFDKDESLGFFLLHLHHLKQVNLLMMLIGLVLAFYFGRGRMAVQQPRASEAPND